ncbi:MAG TPA: DUF222 domain-containing protein [Nocardioidaceae bacterium]|nr:DUF222 domain-containing protein [Nocardioidaceae bacterium]
MFDRYVVDAMEPGPELARALLAVDRSALDRDDLLVWAVASQRLEAYVEACRYEVLGWFADASPVEESPMPGVRGADRSIRPGGDGTPEVSEFAETDLATELHCTTGRAHGLLGDGLDLRHRMPRLFAELKSGRVAAFKVRRILAEAHWLPFFAARLLDGRVAVVAGRVGPKRLGQLVDQVLAEVDPQAAADRAEAARRDRRVDVFSARDGQRHIRADIDALDGIRFDAAVDRVADMLGDLGDTDAKDVRRATAVGWLANPPATLALAEHHRAWMRGQAPAAWATTIVPDTACTPAPAEYGEPGPADYAAAAAVAAAGTDADGFAHADAAGAVPVTHPHLRPGLWPTDVPTPADAVATDLWPAATVYVHMSQQTWRAGTGGVDIDGHGTITADQAFDRLRHHRVTIKPVIDLDDEIRWRAPQGSDFAGGLREAVRLANPSCPFPFADAQAKDSDDFDHTRPRDQGGATALANGAPLRRRLHRVKTFANGWRVKQPFAGIHVWQNPQGRIFICDRRGQIHDLGLTGRQASTIGAKPQ